MEKEPQNLNQNPTSEGRRGNTWPPEDRENLLKAKGGDRQAQAKVIERYKHIARGFSRKFRGNYCDADVEDLYMEGLESILKALRSYGEKLDANGEPHPFWRTAWFIIRSDAATKRRKRKYRDAREKVTSDGTLGYTEQERLWQEQGNSSSLATVNNQRLYSRAWEIARGLRPIYWIVWRLYYGRDMSEADIARELNITRQAVNFRMQRARRKVRETMFYEGFNDYER